jgi:hypothetical protein
VIGERVGEARRQEAELRETVASLSQEAAMISEQLAVAEQRMQDARDTETQALEALAAVRQEQQTMAEERAGLQAQLTELGQAREQLVAEVQQAQDQRNALQDQLAELTERLNTRTDELAALEQSFQQQQQQTARMVGAMTAGIAPGRYAGQPEEGDAMIIAVFQPDGQFEMSGGVGEAAMRRGSAVGRYEVQDNVLTMSEVSGAGAASFPMVCGVETTPTGFQLLSANAERPDDDAGSRLRARRADVLAPRVGALSKHSQPAVGPSTTRCSGRRASSSQRYRATATSASQPAARAVAAPPATAGAVALGEPGEAAGQQVVALPGSAAISSSRARSAVACSSSIKARGGVPSPRRAAARRHRRCRRNARACPQPQDLDLGPARVAGVVQPQRLVEPLRGPGPVATAADGGPVQGQGQRHLAATDRPQHRHRPLALGHRLVRPCRTASIHRARLAWPIESHVMKACSAA